MLNEAFLVIIWYFTKVNLIENYNEVFFGEGLDAA